MGTDDAAILDPALPCARRGGRGEAVLIVDVPPLSDIRARHGAGAAEQARRTVSDCLRRRLRPEDRIAPVRGDGFLAVLPGADDAALAAIAERIRSGVRGLRLSVGGDAWPLDCAVGGAARAARALCLEGLVRAADGALARERRARPAPV